MNQGRVNATTSSVTKVLASIRHEGWWVNLLNSFEPGNCHYYTVQPTHSQAAVAACPGPGPNTSFTVGICTLICTRFILQNI